jgi:hypothetical protein
VGFDPYKRIKRNRTTRRADLAFVLFFAAVIAALLVWAML